ncbi:hypothetical protein ACLOJK_018545 [Asimina triloba]
MPNRELPSQLTLSPLPCFTLPQLDGLIDGFFSSLKTPFYNSKIATGIDACPTRYAITIAHLPQLLSLIVGFGEEDRVAIDCYCLSPPLSCCPPAAIRRCLVEFASPWEAIVAAHVATGFRDFELGMKMGFGSCSPDLPWRRYGYSFATRDEREGHEHCDCRLLLTVVSNRRRCRSPCLATPAGEDNQTAAIAVVPNEGDGAPF